MKRFLVMVYLFISTISTYGQISLECDTTYFRSEDIMRDIKYYNLFRNKYRGDIVKWATAMKNVFPPDEDKYLRFTYILKTDSNLDIESVKNICNIWYDMGFSNKLITYKECQDNRIKGKGIYNTAGLLGIPVLAPNKYLYIHEILDINVSIKEDRIKFEIICRNYHHELKEGPKTYNEFRTPGSLFPFDEEYNVYDKIVYAESYVKFCENSIELARSYLDYLNKSLRAGIIQDDDNW